MRVEVLEGGRINIPGLLQESNARKLACLSRQRRRALTRDADKKGERWLHRTLSALQWRGEIPMGRDLP